MGNDSPRYPESAGRDERNGPWQKENQESNNLESNKKLPGAGERYESNTNAN